jgi:lipoprotein-anchoring transpeptidase ErfK/SrfK
MAVIAAAALTGCTGTTERAGEAASSGPPGPPVSLTITPDDGAKDLPVSSEIGISAANAEITGVTVTKVGGAPVDGGMREDGTSWVPAAPLAYSSAYTASVTARNAAGVTETKTTAFTTMGTPAKELGTGLYMFNGQTVGVGMPVVLEFNPPVPDTARAAVQRRLFVTSSPAQPGAWHWASGSQVWYRPAAYWQVGTAITVRAGLRGLPMGNGYYGDTDRSASVTVGPKVVMEIDNATKQMSVYASDTLVKQLPVSLGKSSTPSSSGNMVVMSKEESTVFDTTAEGPGGYRVTVQNAMRLTWGGEFIHAAPWSEGDQGERNVSHGCVNVSMSNSEWLFTVAHVGDPVTVKGTEVKLVHGNGWTVWDQPWDEYIKGSAIPVPELVVTAGQAAVRALAGN